MTARRAFVVAFYPFRSTQTRVVARLRVSGGFGAFRPRPRLVSSRFVFSSQLCEFLSARPHGGAPFPSSGAVLRGLMPGGGPTVQLSCA